MIDINNLYEADLNVYKYKADMKYINGETTINIDNVNIKSVIIDSDYKNSNMPMIFVTASIHTDNISELEDNQSTGIIILNIQRAVVNSDMPDLYTDYINDKFIYFTTPGNAGDNVVNNDGDIDDRPDLYEIITIGLLSLDHVNKNKKSINGIMNGSLSSIMYYMTSHLPVVIEPPVNNVEFKNKIFPPMNSVSKALKYLNSLQVLYSTNYRFFIDFDYAYLLSSSGKAIKRQGENITSIFIKVKNSYDEGKNPTGMSISEDKSMYLISADANSCEISDNSVTDKFYSKLVATDSDGSVSSKNVNESQKTNVDSKSRNIRVPNNNSGLVDNMISSLNNSTTTILVQLTDVDSSIFTMNKEYVLNMDDIDESSYNGYYILIRKRELYIRTNEDYSMNVMLLFEKVAK